MEDRGRYDQSRRPRRGAFAFALAALIGATGCAAEEPAAQGADFAATEASVIEAELGDSYDLHVEPAAVVGQTAALRAVSFPITPTQPFAAVMRKTDDSALDPWLALYVDGDRVAVSDWDQAVVPMAEESDAVIVYTPRRDGTAMVVAGDLDMRADADFQLDLVSLAGSPPTALPLHETSPGTRVMTDALRGREPQTQLFLDAGMVTEGAAGRLDEHPEKAPSLKDRAALRAFVTAVNDERGQLFAEPPLPEATDGEAALITRARHREHG